MLLGLGVVYRLPNHTQQSAQCFDIFLRRILMLPQQLLDALMHDSLGQHLLFVQFPHQPNITFNFVCFMLFSLPSFKFLLTSVQKKSFEGDTFIHFVEIRQYAGETRTETSVHFTQGWFHQGFVKDLQDDASKSDRIVDVDLLNLHKEFFKILRQYAGETRTETSVHFTQGWFHQGFVKDLQDDASKSDRIVDVDLLNLHKEFFKILRSSLLNVIHSLNVGSTSARFRQKAAYTSQKVGSIRALLKICETAPDGSHSPLYRLFLISNFADFILVLGFVHDLPRCLGRGRGQ
ncbi:hypothetical protein C4D60_Mb11t20660 [Musa balbisiana]|uniref:Uncharacterized protein n=1 Tax=Musa balbisiana TaxID=52838 RepID=A0A4S8J5T8_MUSBA|nr:hypothetical protein C4D60_Mb11t20660 [Musa balbisiana]